MKLGIHAYEWCSVWSNDTLDIIDTVRDLGFDFIEIPLMRLDLFDPAAVRQRLDGFEVTVTAFGLTVSWECGSAAKANNSSGKTYRLTAIG